MEGFFNFGLVKPDGMEIFGVRTDTEGGVLQSLRELGARRYAINLFDPAFSILILLVFGCAVVWLKGVHRAMSEESEPRASASGDDRSLTVAAQNEDAHAGDE